MNCRVCRCSQDRPCEPPCGWAHQPGEQPICSTCVQFRRQMEAYLRSSGAMSAAVLRMYGEVGRSSRAEKGSQRMKAEGETP